MAEQAKQKRRRKKPVNDKQLDLLSVRPATAKGKRKAALAKGQVRRYRSKSGHVYELSRVE